MTLRFVYIICLFYIPLTGFANTPTGYLPGYIVTHKNDTVHGLIKDRAAGPFARLFEKIRFRQGPLLAKKLGPHQIAGYSRGGNVFESVWINTSGEFFRTSYESRPRHGKKQFMKVRVKGYLTYYQWEYLDHDTKNIDHIDLYKREKEDCFLKVTQGVFGLREKSLGSYFLDCPDLVWKIENRQLRSPLEIAEFYNDWWKKNSLPGN